MLIRLKIKNLAVLKDIELDFDSGLTVISGESGAGKSMIIEAIRYLYGKRASIEDIRYETEGALIEGVFDFPESDTMRALLAQNDIEEDELYIVRREVMQNRKSIIKINSRMITLGALKDIMDEVVSIHSQSSQSEALEHNKHILYLDRYIDASDRASFGKYQESFEEFKALEARIRELEYKDKNRVQQLQMFKYEYEELEAMDLVPDEEEKLEEEISYLDNFEKISNTLSSIQAQLSSEYAPQNMLYEIHSHIETLSNFDENYKEYGDTVLEAYHTLDELGSRVGSDLSALDYDEESLNAKQSRLSDINSLKRKYNKTLDELIEYRIALAEDIEQLGNIAQSFEALQNRRAQAQKRMEQYAKDLHTFRLEQKHFLENRIKKELNDLDMPGADFEISVREGTFDPRGYSEVEFLISTNAGEPLKSMNRIASGGEIARVMLALRTIFTESDAQSLLILDEIDTGVSGLVATRMAEKMQLLSKSRQVISISHLPQAAALADHHLYVSKKTSDQRTASAAAYLDADDHIYEIARMLSGSDITEAALENAKTLIEAKNKETN
ncbi:DNA repair protein RecN [Salinicoccus hispanicus]|uniref:DNA repair protein RecN n=1 Tax=Salinicoccus hispanicus TaxID=157225 RepID=A0A6N8TYW9_9STAP|nr:DNA repair protein RecN [Salinicoccus hispanicus]MXQ50227.1 DNA repair protein RecN [Salinicoccus hispanicus]